MLFALTEVAAFRVESASYNGTASATSLYILCRPRVRARGAGVVRSMTRAARGRLPRVLEQISQPGSRRAPRVHTETSVFRQTHRGD
jgi:hypothetical protein